MYSLGYIEQGNNNFMNQYFINFSSITEKYLVKKVGHVKPYTVDVSYVLGEFSTRYEAEQYIKELSQHEKSNY